MLLQHLKMTRVYVSNMEGNNHYPGSYLYAVDWFNKTALDRILHIDGQHTNKSRISRELDIIEDRKEDI